MLYAVKVGRNPGIYETWDECKKQVNKYPGAEYRKVKSFEEGIEFMSDSNTDPGYGYYIDGSYMDRIGGYGYSVVICDSKIRYQEYGRVPKDFRVSRNIGPEFYAALRAMKIIARIGMMVEPVIHYDYEGTEKFLRGWEPRTDISRRYKLEAQNIFGMTDAKIEFSKVRAHSGDTYNSLADGLAKQGAMMKDDKKIVVTNLEELEDV